MKGVVAISAHLLIRKCPLKYCRLLSTITSNSSYHQIIGQKHHFVLSLSRNGREFSSESLLEREKHMYSLRRRMMTLYQGGLDYKGALRCAIELADSVAACEELGGKSSSIYASSLNNVALMQKMCGQNEEAVQSYTDAVQIYRGLLDRCDEENFDIRPLHDEESESMGSDAAIVRTIRRLLTHFEKEIKESDSHTRLSSLAASYASSLTNLGALYRQIADDSSSDKSSSPIDRQQLAAKAEESLSVACEIRSLLLGPAHRDTLYAKALLCGSWRLQKRSEEALQGLREALAVASEHYGDSDVVVATVCSSLSLLLKGKMEFPEAEALALRAFAIRRASQGPAHQDTVVAMHNLAELYLVQGATDPDKATLAAELQREIISVVEAPKRAPKEDRPQEEAIREAVEAMTSKQPPIDQIKKSLGQQEQKKKEPDVSPPYTFTTRRKKKT